MSDEQPRCERCGEPIRPGEDADEWLEPGLPLPRSGIVVGVVMKYRHRRCQPPIRPEDFQPVG
jgi:hypothetical protein